MSGKLLETGITRHRSKEGIRMYAGKEVAAEFGRQEMYAIASQIHGALGENRRFMHQPETGKIIDGLEGGTFVIAVKDSGLVVATSHLRPAKSSAENRELGGVLNIQKVRGQGRAVVEEGVRLALEEHGASGVEALAANENEAAQKFFRGLGAESTGERPSDYVKDAKGRPLMMTIFDVTNAGQRRVA